MKTTAGRPPFWRRLCAALLDLALLMILVGLWTYFLVWITGGRLQARLFETNSKPLSYGYILLTVSFVPYTLFYALQESSRRQATPGKRLLGLAVTTPDGQRVPLGRAVLRTTVKFLPWELGHISLILFSDLTVSGLASQGFPFTPETRFLVSETPLAAPIRVLAFALLGAGILATLFERRRRGLHDLLAGTLVVTDRSRR